jgi:CheY-like chemotaxis protein
MAAIGKSAEDADRRVYCLDKIEEASNHLHGVINDILDMSKIEANKFELSAVSFSFKKVLQQVANIISFQISRKQQNFSMHLDENIPDTLYGDDQRLAQVITNLLSNAIKFTPENGDIRLETRFWGLKDDLCTIEITVKDSGIGISPEQAALLFRPFQQAEGSTSRKFGGTGLGLTISKSIIEMMNGKIWVESKPGEGSVFGFSVKMKRTDIKFDGRSTRVVVKGKNDIPQTATENDHGIFKGRKMLLTEDVEINREIVMSLLEPTGIEIECAENGAEAIQKFSAAPERYDIIFMDIQMPNMDGYEATKRLRALNIPRAAQVPIVAMTANVFREDVEKCLKTGMNDHVGKPLDLSEIMEKLRQYLSC